MDEPEVRIVTEAPKPEVDVVKCADEIKAYIWREKLNMVDSDNPTIESYPAPDDPEMPELCRFRDLHEDFFAYVSTLDVDNAGNGYPFDLADEFHARIADVQRLVNADETFWVGIQDEVLPLYKGLRISRSKDGKLVFDDLEDKKSAAWANRWRSITLLYDPIAEHLETKMSYKDARTGKIKEGTSKVINDRVIPAGFVIKIH